MRLELPFDATVPTGVTNSGRAPGCTCYKRESQIFWFEAECRQIREASVRWRAQSYCANERELQLPLCASHFRTPPVCAHVWALFMSFYPCTTTSVMHLWPP